MARAAGLRPDPAPVEFPFPVSFLEDLIEGVFVRRVPAFGDEGPLGSNIGCIVLDGEVFHLDAFHAEFVAFQDSDLPGPRLLQLLGRQEGLLLVILGIDPGIFSQARQIDVLALVVSLFACFEELVDRFVVLGLMVLDQGNPLRGGASEEKEADKDCARCGEECSHDHAIF